MLVKSLQILNGVHGAGLICTILAGNDDKAFRLKIFFLKDIKLK